MDRERFRRIASYALGRSEAYVIVGVTFAAVLAAILGGWPGWIIPAALGGGVLLLGLLVWDTLADPSAERDASLADLDPCRIRDKEMQEKARRALEYVRGAQRLAREDREGILGAASAELPQLERAARLICQMGLRLQEFRSDRLIQQDLASLREQPSGEAKHLSADQMAHRQSLQELQRLVDSAQEEMDNTLANLGRSYAEMQSIKVTPEVRGRAIEALEELKSSAQRLADLADGYDAAYGRRSAAGT